jgi:RNA-binding protein
MHPEIPKKELNNLKKAGIILEPTLRIGKNGVNDNVINEVEKLIKKRKLIKIKTLRAFSDCYDVDDAINKIVEKTNSILVSKTGFNFVLYKNISTDVKKEVGKVVSKKYDIRKDKKSKLSKKDVDYSKNNDFSNSKFFKGKKRKSVKSKNFGQYYKLKSSKSRR